MPAVFAHGSKARLAIWDSAGASKLVQGDVNSITLSWSRDNIEVTTMGQVAKQRLGGLTDGNLQGAGLYNSESASGTQVVLKGLESLSAVTLINFIPSGSIAGCPLYAACMILGSYEVNSPVNGPVALSYSFQLGSGSITSTCCV